MGLLHALAAPFKAIGKGLKAVFSPHKVHTVLSVVDSLVDEAMPFVEAIALMTPTRSDDELLAAAEQYAFGDFSLQMFTDKGEALKAIVRFALSEKIRGEVASDALVNAMRVKKSILNAAVDLAYAVYHNGQEE